MPIVATPRRPSTTSARAVATVPTIPTWTTASTSMNRPTKKNSVLHSMSRRDSCGSSGPTIIRTVAPRRAIVAASTPSTEWKRKPTRVRPSTTSARIISGRSVIAAAGSSVSHHVQPVVVVLQRAAEPQPQDPQEDDHDHEDHRRQVDEEVDEVEPGRRADEDVRRVADEGRGAADVRGEDLADEIRERRDLEGPRDRQGDRRQQDDRRHVVEDRREQRRRQREHHEQPERLAARTVDGQSGDVLEEAGLTRVRRPGPSSRPAGR